MSASDAPLTPSLSLRSGRERLGQQSTDHVRAGATFLSGNLVDLGYGVRVEPDRVHGASGHVAEGNTVGYNVSQCDTLTDMHKADQGALRTDDACARCRGWKHLYCLSCGYGGSWLSPQHPPAGSLTCGHCNTRRPAQCCCHDGGVWHERLYR